jgi:hypothetical protein
LTGHSAAKVALLLAGPNQIEYSSPDCRDLISVGKNPRGILGSQLAHPVQIDRSAWSRFVDRQCVRADLAVQKSCRPKDQGLEPNTCFSDRLEQTDRPFNVGAKKMVWGSIAKTGSHVKYSLGLKVAQQSAQLRLPPDVERDVVIPW